MVLNDFRGKFRLPELPELPGLLVLISEIPDFVDSVYKLKCVFDIIDLRYKFVTLTLILCRRIIQF